MAVGDVYSVVLHSRQHAQDLMNVMHYENVSGGTPDDSSLIAAAWLAQHTAAWRACCSDEWEILGLSVQKIKPVPVLLAFTQSLSNNEGTVAGDSLPTSMSAVITKRTAFGGPSGRGRLYLAGVPLSFELNSTVTDAGLLIYQTLGNLLDNNITLAGGAVYRPVVWNRTDKTTRPIVSTLARRTLRNQRRRQVGRGI